jgi:hypothetical protein
VNQPDIQKTAEVVSLLQTPPDQRDDAWRTAFLQAIPNAALAPGSPQLVQGPDGFPYAALQTPERGQTFTSYSLLSVLQQVTETGVGLVLNPQNDIPDWVFSYGDLLELRLRGELRLHYPAERPQEDVTPGEEVMVGQPSESYLPAYARRVLDAHLKRVGVPEPVALLMFRPSENANTLVFPFTPEEFGSEEVLRDVLASVGWFLPRDYVVAALNHPDLLFVPLDPDAPLPAPPPPAPAPEPEPPAARPEQPAPEPPAARTEPPASSNAEKRPWYRRLF